MLLKFLVPLGVGYPVQSSTNSECAALFRYELDHDADVISEVHVSELPTRSRGQEKIFPDVDLSKTDLSAEQTSQLRELLAEFSDVFSKKRRDYGRTRSLTHSIKSGGASPIKKTPYRLPQIHMAAAEQQVKEKAEDDLIELVLALCALPL